MTTASGRREGSTVRARVFVHTSCRMPWAQDEFHNSHCSPVAFLCRLW